MRRTPRAIILAGPNGAGKSTLKERLVPDGVEFLNADEIARGIAGDPGPARDIAAGRLLLSQLSNKEKTGEDFAIETNLASRGLAVRIPKWQKTGYRVSLAFVWVPHPDFAVARVAQRVRYGGHDIPKTTIYRRYAAGLKNLFEVYLPLVDSWRVYDNSSDAGPRLIAHAVRRIILPDLWQQIQQPIQSEEEGGEP